MLVNHVFFYYCDILFFALFEVAVRICVREALKFKRNKKQVKSYKSSIHPFRRTLRLYYPRETYAPKNMYYYQTIRAVYLLTLFVIGILSCFGETDVCERIFFAKAILLYLPFCIYGMIVTLLGPAGEKNIDFRIFKKP